MQNETKIRLSAFEQDLIKNADWILTKNQIIEKMKQLLQQCLEKQKETIEQHKFIFSEEVISVAPKISKGENYKGLPWLMLDYPRYFDKENVFAIRTFFWWGHYFSTTLHLSGRYKNLFAEKITGFHPSLIEQPFYLGINKTEWEHHFNIENYKLIHEISDKEFHQIISEKKFIKLSMKINLEEWDQLPSLTAFATRFFLEILS